MEHIDIKKRILEVLQNGHLMSLGTSDKNGPWVADVIYIHDEALNIYWMSSPATRHSGAIETAGKAAGSITVTAKSKEDNFGIQFEGAAHKIDGKRHDLAIKHFAKRGRPAPNESDDILHGASWYAIKPSKIYLIDENNFGFKRQLLEL
jgi:uncharacterized protein